MFKRKIDINLKKVSCPDCGAEQPRVRKPKGWNEILWGGSTCKECGCKMDRHGRRREK